MHTKKPVTFKQKSQAIILQSRVASGSHSGAAGPLRPRTERYRDGCAIWRDGGNELPHEQGGRGGGRDGRE